MLEDRDYMWPPSYGWRWSLATVLLVANAVIFVLQAIVEQFVNPFLLSKYFALSLGGIQKGFVWQLITFQFMHSGLLHLLGNLLVIYFFGRPLEEDLGRKSFLKIYFGGGIFGGLLQLLAFFLLPNHFQASGVMGASAGAFALVAAFAALYPERPLTLLVFFVIPVTMRARFLLLFAVALTVFGLVVPFGNIAHAAHLGGLLVGFVFVRLGLQRGWPLPRRSAVRRPSPRPALAGVVRSRKEWRGNTPPSAQPPAAEFISKQVDPILDKISAHGIQSLTPEERRILEAASARMDRR
jgi:membrane associated rhomboid family serine protease